MKEILSLTLFLCVSWINIILALPKVETLAEVENVFSSEFSAAGSRLPTAQDAHKWVSIKSTALHLSWSDRFSIAINKAVTAYSVFLNLPQSEDKAASAIIHDTNNMNHKLSGLKAATKYLGELQALVGPHKWPYKLLNFTVTTPALLNGLEAAVLPKVSVASDISDLEGVSVDVQLRWPETPYKTDGIPPSSYLLKLWQKDQVLREEVLEGISHRTNEVMETSIGGLSLDKLYKITLEGRNSKGKPGITLSFSLTTGSLFASESVFMTGGVAGCFSALQVRCPYSDRCVSPYWICDGSKDCPEGEDEDACDEVEPCQNGFRCWGSNKCLPASWRCDGFEDCLDGDDELGCNNCAGEDLLRCGTGSDCVSVGYACDGQKQCPDGWDETDAICNLVISSFELGSLSKAFECPSGKESCGINGGCVARTSLCDNIQDCPIGEDENALFCHDYRNCTNMTSYLESFSENILHYPRNILHSQDSDILTGKPDTSSNVSENIKLPAELEKTTLNAAKTVSTIFQVPSTSEQTETPTTISSTLLVSKVLVSDVPQTLSSFVTASIPSTGSSEYSTQAVTQSYASKQTDPLTPSETQTSHSLETQNLTSNEPQTPTTPQPESSTPSVLQSSTFPTTQVTYVETTTNKVKLNGNSETTKSSISHLSSNHVTVTSKCRADEFDCGDGWCVPLFWLCDGRFDCLDGADEDPKTCETIVEGVDQSIEENYVEEVPNDLLCPVDYVQCSTGLCIDKSKICDGHHDCPGKEDEHSCAETSEAPKLKVFTDPVSESEIRVVEQKPSMTFLEGNDIPTVLEYDAQSYVPGTFYDHFDNSESAELSESPTNSHNFSSVASSKTTLSTFEQKLSSTWSSDQTDPSSDNSQNVNSESDYITTEDYIHNQPNDEAPSAGPLSTNITDNSSPTISLMSSNQSTIADLSTLAEESDWLHTPLEATDHTTAFPKTEADNIDYGKSSSDSILEQTSSHRTSYVNKTKIPDDVEPVVPHDPTDYYFHSYEYYEGFETWSSTDSSAELDNESRNDQNLHNTLNSNNDSYLLFNSPSNNVEENGQKLSEDTNVSSSANNETLLEELDVKETDAHPSITNLTFNPAEEAKGELKNDTDIDNLQASESNNVTLKISGTTSEDGFLVLSTSSTDHVSSGNSTVLIAIHAKSVNGNVPDFVIHNTNGTQYNFDVIAVINKPLKRNKVEALASEEIPKSKYILEKVITFRLESNGKLQYNPVILSSPYNLPLTTSKDEDSATLPANQHVQNISCITKNETKAKESTIFFIDQIKPVILNVSTTKATTPKFSNGEEKFQSNVLEEKRNSNINIITIIPAKNFSFVNTFPSPLISSLPNITLNETSLGNRDNFTKSDGNLMALEGDSVTMGNSDYDDYQKNLTEDPENSDLLISESFSQSQNDPPPTADEYSTVKSQNLLLSDNDTTLVVRDISSTESHFTTAVTEISTTTSKRSLGQSVPTPVNIYDYPDEWLEQNEHFDDARFSQDFSNSLGSSSRDPDYINQRRSEKHDDSDPGSIEDLYTMESEKHDDMNYLSNNINANGHDSRYYDLDYEMKNDLNPFEKYDDSNSIEPIQAEQINQEYIRDSKGSLLRPLQIEMIFLSISWLSYNWHLMCA